MLNHVLPVSLKILPPVNVRPFATKSVTTGNTWIRQVALANAVNPVLREQHKIQTLVNVSQFATNNVTNGNIWTHNLVHVNVRNLVEQIMFRIRTHVVVLATEPVLTVSQILNVFAQLKIVTPETAQSIMNGITKLVNVNA